MRAGFGRNWRRKTLSETIRFFPNEAYVEQSDKGEPCWVGKLSGHPAAQKQEEWCMSFNRPTEEQIRSRAREIFFQHGSQPGHDMDNWLQAENELMPFNVRRH
jgi:hypothetical protein